MGKGGKRQAWPSEHVDVGAVEIWGQGHMEQKFRLS